MSLVYRATPSDGIAWITGGSTGIGRATALELSRRGYTVAITARRADELAKVAAQAPVPGSIHTYEGDVTEREALAELVARIERELGPISLAFLNVGTFHPMKPGSPFDAELVIQTFDVNIGGTVNALAPVLAAMAQRGRGLVAVNASIAGYGGLPGAAAYGATKAALINMCEALKFSLDPQGIAIQLVSPGFVGTPLTARNDFPMPLLMSAEEAAKRICDGFGRSGFEITFPRRLSWLLKAINVLPYALYFALVGRATRRKR